MSLLTIVLLSAAITVVYTLGSIFARVRDHGPKLWQEWGHCPICCGTWIGAGVCAAFGDVWQLHPAKIVLFLLGVGCLSGVVALLARRAIDGLGVLEDAISAHALHQQQQQERLEAAQSKLVAAARNRSQKR